MVPPTDDSQLQRRDGARVIGELRSCVCARAPSTRLVARILRARAFISRRRCRRRCESSGLYLVSKGDERVVCARAENQRRTANRDQNRAHAKNAHRGENGARARTRQTGDRCERSLADRRRGALSIGAVKTRASERARERV